MSIVAMRAEIESQPDELSEIAERLSENSIRLPPSQAVFTGSGDSWAAALFSREIAKGTVLAADPAELLSDFRLVNNRHIVLISASGKTRANIELAKKARASANKTIAVTSYSNSPLARACHSSIVLAYRRAATLTPGTISFTASLLACAKLLHVLPKGFKPQSSLLEAEKWARDARLNNHGKCIFVGSGVDRAIAEYGACKTQEVLGLTALATYPEQVGHAILFSLNPVRDTIVCIDTTRNVKTGEVYDRLLRAGFRAYKFSSGGKDPLTNCLEACFRLQFLSLLSAERAGKSECAFLRDKSRLKLSDKLIY